MSSRFDELRALGRGAAFATVSAAALGTVRVQEELLPDSDVDVAAYRRHLTRLGLKALGVRAIRLGQNPPLVRPRLIVANHQSAIDIGLVLHFTPGAILSRADLESWPIIGELAKRNGTIFVDRSRQLSGLVAIRQMRRLLKSGTPLIVFPEGTTYFGNVVQPFQGGAFAAIEGLDAEILPVGIAYRERVPYTGQNFVQHVHAIAKQRHTSCCISIGRPFAVEGTRTQIAERARQEVQQLADGARTRLDVK